MIPPNVVTGCKQGEYSVFHLFIVYHRPKPFLTEWMLNSITKSNSHNDSKSQESINALTSLSLFCSSLLYIGYSICIYPIIYSILEWPAKSWQQNAKYDPLLMVCHALLLPLFFSALSTPPLYISSSTQSYSEETLESNVVSQTGSHLIAGSDKNTTPLVTVSKKSELLIEKL